MDVREKLVELIEKASYECDEGTRDLWDMRQVADGIADFLIAHGVTVQERISVKDRLPERFGSFAVDVKELGGKMYSDFADYDPYEKWWSTILARGIEDIVTHWMPLPPAPTTCHMTSEQQTRGE